MRISSSIVPGTGAIVLAAVLLGGCSKPQVEVYTIPPLPPRLKAPDHWKKVDTSAMVQSEKQRFEIAMTLEDTNATALVTMTVLPGKGEMSKEAYLRINVNRWRRQAGMAELKEEESLEDHVATVAGLPDVARMVDVNGTEMRTVGVLIPRVNALWVYKLSGHPIVVDKERNQFLKLLPDWR